MAVIATMAPGDNSRNHYVWVGADGGRLFVNTESGHGVRALLVSPARRV